MMSQTYAAIMNLCAKKDRTWSTFTARQRKLVALADPRTGGDNGLAHNWGNDASRAVMANGWRRWHAYSEAFHARYSLLARQYGREASEETRQAGKAANYRQRRVRRG